MAITEVDQDGRGWMPNLKSLSPFDVPSIKAWTSPQDTEIELTLTIYKHF
jgi:hypothetical protein